MKAVQHCAQGLLPIQTSALDVHGAYFKAEARRQSPVVAESAQARDDQAFVDAVSGRTYE